MAKDRKPRHRWQDVQSALKSKDELKKKRKHFYCPVGVGILWEHGLEYKECPLFPEYQDMTECKSCKHHAHVTLTKDKTETKFRRKKPKGKGKKPGKTKRGN